MTLTIGVAFPLENGYNFVPHGFDFYTQSVEATGFLYRGSSLVDATPVTLTINF